MPLDGLYAHVETDFIRSHRYIDLTPATRCLYLSIWCYALEHRREIIERPSNCYLTAIAGLKHHDCNAMLMRLNDERLLIVNENYIAVVGLRKKHNKIKFKKEFENSGIEFEISQDCSFLSYPFQNIPKHTNTPPTPRKRVEKVEPEPTPKNLYLELENEAWNVYPITQPKARSQRHLFREQWEKRMREEEPPEVILEGIRNFAAYQNGRDPNMIPGAQVFIGKQKKYLGWVQQEDLNISPALQRTNQAFDKLHKLMEDKNGNQNL